jgi:predicted Zn-dependent peptidase
MQAHFQGHPLGQAILGSDESITNLSCEEMQAYHQDRYHAGNVLVVVAGATDEHTIKGLADKACGPWRSGKKFRLVEEARPQKSLVVIEKPQTLQQIFTQMGKAPAATHPLYHAADILCGIVGDSSTSRLYWELVDNGMAESADLDFHDYEGSGTYLAFMNCDPELAKENMEKMQEIFAGVNLHGVSQHELDVAKSKLMSRLVIRSERPMGRLSALGGNWIYRKEYRSVAEDLSLIDSISLEDIRQVLKEYPIEMLTTVAVGPMTTEQVESIIN